jgi:mRNA-degrading endonuclease RelE of RelBE toxin-antitoxin system
MSYKVELSEHFIREAKRISKKYPSLKVELNNLFSELENNPQLGIPLGNQVYKIRLAISSKGRGKSEGARVITYMQIDEQTVLLLSIYNKGERDSISDKEICDLLAKYFVG